MSNETMDFYEKFKKDIPKMKAQAPNAMEGFMGLFSKVMGEGAISVKEKEMIALGIGCGTSKKR